MAGAFGYEAKYADLSRGMAERVLAPSVRNAGDATILSTGNSCRAQIGHVTPREAKHPAVFLAERLDVR